MSGFFGRRPFRGALAIKAADETAINVTAGYTIPWTSEDYDTDNIHDNVTNNSRLTVPTGVTRVRLILGLTLLNVLTANYIYALVQKNGVSQWNGCPRQKVDSDDGMTFPMVNLVSAVVTVTGGDYFTAQINVSADTSVDIQAATSFFAMEIIE